MRRHLRLSIIVALLASLVFAPAAGLPARAGDPRPRPMCLSAVGRKAAPAPARPLLAGVELATTGSAPFHNGVFAGPSAFAQGGIEDPVAYYKGAAQQIKAGTLLSRQQFLPSEYCLWGEEPVPLQHGGMLYSMSVITGLQAGDIVSKTFDLYYTYDVQGGSYTWDFGYQVCFLTGDYTHTLGTRIDDWLHYIEKEADGTYTLVTGEGMFWGVFSESDLPAYDGYGFRTVEHYQVYTGATLVNPQPNPRGYEYGTDGVTGGWVRATDVFTNQQDGVNAVWVDDDFDASIPGWGRTHFASIQQGVDAVLPGGAVHVAAGTYTEQVAVTKTVALQGATEASTAIGAPATMVADGCASIVSIGGQGVDAELSGFTLRGPATAGPFAGILVRDGANARVHDSTITAIHGEPLSDSVGIWVGGPAPAVTATATISDNVIFDYGTGGIVVENAGSSATLRGNTVTGSAAAGSPVQNGIVITGGATALLEGNTLVSHTIGVYVSGSAGASVARNTLLSNTIGVNLAGGAAGNAITGNDLLANGMGILIAEDGGAGNEAHGNCIVGNTWGVSNTTTVDFDATYNWWGSPTGPTHVGNPEGTGDPVSDHVRYDPYWTREGGPLRVFLPLALK